MRAQFEAPSLLETMTTAGLVPGVRADQFIIDECRWPNPYGARRYPRMGMMRKPRPAPDRDWWDDDE